MRRRPRESSWKYIRKIGDEIKMPYRWVAKMWMTDVIARTKTIRKMRK